MEKRFDQINTAEDVRSLLLFAALNGDDPESLRKRILGGFKVELVKHNPKRKIYRLVCPDGHDLYLKLFAGRHFPFSVFRFYAAKEYVTARKLEKLGLPVIRYLAWGRLRKGGFCVSEGVPEACPALRYFFETVKCKPALEDDFLHALVGVTRALCCKNIRHRDFHLGNIIYSVSERRAYLADPWGIRTNFRLSARTREGLCHPWAELHGSISGDQLLSGLLSSGLAATKMAALELLEQTEKAWRRRQTRRRKKLVSRILGGKSKFATTVDLPDGACSFRHTRWFTPPEKLEIDPGWRGMEFESLGASEKIWLDSFLSIPPKKNPPLARLVRPDGASVLFYAE